MKNIEQTLKKNKSIVLFIFSNAFQKECIVSKKA